jgi:PTS system galactitol-specific IIB component
VCEEAGFKVNIQQTKVVQVEGIAKDFDLIVASTKVPTSVTTPYVSGLNYLTGINREKTDAEIIDTLKKLDSQN